MQNFDHNIGFREKRQFFRQKLSKIAENCDHNIDPWSPCMAKQKTCVLVMLSAPDRNKSHFPRSAENSNFLN
jgi:hypothetical protein